MRKVLGFAAALLLVVGVAGAWAENIEGKITAVDKADRTIQLDYVTVISLAEGLPMDKLEEGMSVKASYEERGDKKVATRISVAE